MIGPPSRVNEGAPAAADPIMAIVEEESPAAEALLLDLIRLPSHSGREADAMALVLDAFRPFVDAAELVPLSDDLTTDTEYSTVIPELRYAGRFNARLTAGEGAPGPSLLVNTHLDVVPASKGQSNAFDPCVRAGAVHGRGACDAKGQVACLYLALRVLSRLRLRPGGPLTVHFVVEEENGGNGTLAMIRSGDRADVAVVLEPTGGTVVSSVRGAVWFRVRCDGLATHSGSHGRAISALKNSIEAMTIIERFHAALLQRSAGVSLFEVFENPMPLTFGRLQAGNWPASTPDEATLEGVMGFLPNVNREQVMAGIEQALRTEGSSRLTSHYALEFMYRHDGYVLDQNHEIVRRAEAACRAAGVIPQIAAFPASCDSWFYNNLMGVPTIVYGPGHLAVAHSADERLDLRDLRESSRVLASLIAGAPLHP